MQSFSGCWGHNGSHMHCPTQASEAGVVNHRPWARSGLLLKFYWDTAMLIVYCLWVLLCHNRADPL